MKKHSELQYPDLQTLVGTFCDPSPGEDDALIGLLFTKQYSVEFPELFESIMNQLKKAESDQNLQWEELNIPFLHFANADETRAWLKKIRLILEAAQEKIQD